MRQVWAQARAASADRTQRTTVCSHLAIDEVELRGICEGGGRNLPYHVIDERNACLDGVGPVFGGPGYVRMTVEMVRSDVMRSLFVLID